MIETEDPLIRPKGHIEKIRSTISFLFLSLITSIIRKATCVVRGIYKGYVWFRGLKLKWKLLLFLVIIISLLVGGFAINRHVKALSLEKERQRLEQELDKQQNEINNLKDEVDTKNKEIEKLTLARQTKKIVSTATRTPFNGVLEGKISHYSRNGCLGCGANLTMANGEPLDDNRLTIAVPPNTIPMNTQVKVTNLTNGKSTIAVVTDTGGFATLGRVADLTPAVASQLDTRTDISDVRIEPLL